MQSHSNCPQMKCSPIWRRLPTFTNHDSSPFNMASSQDQALQALSSELAQLDRQITALLKRQDELLQQKSQLEASREVSPSVVAPASTL
ncbi:hypothetical protein SRHO_G00033640 [Serrasalmus rhombeus]